MTEEVTGQATPAAPDSAPSAGSALRAARERQGMHIATLAASMKVSPRKLEALENNRLDELPDVTFARALAQTMCRLLRIDAKPVLDLMPAAGTQAMATVAKIESTPYKDHNSRVEQSKLRSLGPLFWAALALVAAATMVFLAPPTWFEFLNPAPSKVVLPVGSTAPAAEPDATAQNKPAPAVVEDPRSALPSGAAPALAPGLVAASGPVLSNETVFSAPPTTPVGASASKRSLVITTSESTWVEVLDASGRALINETVAPGRTVGLDGTPPLKVMVGNASATRMTFMGRTIDVTSNARENVARFELK